MSLEKDVRALSLVPIFAHFENEALRLLAFTAEKITLAKGDVLFRAGDVSDCGFIVLSGSVGLGSRDDDTMPELVVHPPALIGELAMIVPTELRGDAIAAEDSEVLKIPRKLFLRVLREFPEGTVHLRQSMSEQLAKFVGKLLEINSDQA